MSCRCVETIARSYLINELARCGIQVAQPLQDVGVDLLAYLDRESPDGDFRAWPLQLKANYDEGFSVDTKYADIPSLIIVFAWHLKSESATEFYALRYAEVEQLADRMGWAWRGGGRWVVTRPPQRLRKELQAYRAMPLSGIFSVAESENIKL